jgi:hypothetical protein
VFLLVVWLGQRSLLYFPQRDPIGPAASYLPGATDLSFTTEDGLRLSGWFVPASAKPSGITVLVCSGNGGDRSHRAGLARGLASAGHAVMLYDYRGYGGNPGMPTEAGLSLDARAALDHLASRADVDAARIVYFGESLGAAVAATLAHDRPPYALVLRSPFPSLAEVGRLHYPYLPVFDLLLRDRYRVSDALRDVRAPVLVLASEGDTLVPAPLSRQVHDRLSAPKRLVVFSGFEHNDPGIAEGPAMLAEVGRFLDDVTARALR